MNYNNLKKACFAKGILLSQYLESKGLSTSNTGKWKNGGNPSIPLLIEMANDLDVDVNFLLGIEKDASAEASDEEYNIERFRALIQQLTHEGRDSLLEYAQFLRDKEASQK